MDTPADGLHVLDGGLATELERRGGDTSGPLWSAHVLLDRPELVEAVHAAYIDAGADVITTASYQISFEGFANAGLSAADARRALRASLDVAAAARRRAAVTGRRRVLIAASLGPYGAILHNGAEYHGRYGLAVETLVAFHRSRLEHLRRGPCDLIACETIPTLEEGRAVVAALAAFPGLRGWLSFTAADDRHTAGGDDVEAAAALAEAAPQIVAVGINCTHPVHISGLLGRLRAHTTKPLIAYPNAGETWDAAGRRWVGSAGRPDLAALAVEWYGRGARWIGGCCRTTPGDIAAMRAALDACVR